MNGKTRIEQVKFLKYLDIFIIIPPGLSSKRWALSLANIISQAIVPFHFTKRNQYTPTVLQIFNAKVIPQLLFSIHLQIGS